MVANETIKQKHWRKLKFLVVLLVGISILLSGCTEEQIIDSLDLALDILLETSQAELTQTESTEPTTQVTHESQTIVSVNGEMTVHFIDVGQSDATLIIQNGYVMLFDAAQTSRGDELVEYLKNLGITRIHVLVLSHPHDDHMGGAADILNNFEVDIVYGPDIFELLELDSPNWYEQMMLAIDKIDLERNPGVPEEDMLSIWHFPRNDNGEFVNFNIGDAYVEFLAPLEDEYSDKNDYSICAKITYGSIDIMLTGDATTKVEKALIKEGYNLDVEIFQASHHGSDTGNSKEFLEAMSPEYIIVSCGMKNKYNHPSKSVVDLYKEMEIPIFRTDESGNIIMTTDGTTYSFNVEPGTYTSGAEYKAKGG